MSFWEDAWENAWNATKRAAVGFSTGGLSEVARRGQSNRRDEQEAARLREQGLNAQRLSLIQDGMAMGRDRAQQLTGMSAGEIGQDARSIYDQRKALTAGPSRASAEIRRSGQNTARRQRMAGASDAQQRQTQIDTSRAAGMQADIDLERRLQSQQDLLGSMLRTTSALEPAYGQLMLSSQYIAPEQRNQGLIGDLFQGLGLT